MESSKDGSTIAIPWRDGHYIIQVADIAYIQSDGSYAGVFLKDKEKIVATEPLKYFITKLKECNFITISRYHLVNSAHITNIHTRKNWYVEVGKDTNLGISRGNHKRIKAFLDSK